MHGVGAKARFIPEEHLPTFRPGPPGNGRTGLTLPPLNRLGIALMSYNGAINFGLIGDYDTMPDLEDVARYLGEELEELADVAGVTLTTVGIGTAATTARTTHALQGQGSSS